MEDNASDVMQDGTIPPSWFSNALTPHVAQFFHGAFQEQRARGDMLQDKLAVLLAEDSAVHSVPLPAGTPVPGVALDTTAYDASSFRHVTLHVPVLLTHGGRLHGWKGVRRHGDGNGGDRGYGDGSGERHETAGTYSVTKAYASLPSAGASAWLLPPRYSTPDSLLYSFLRELQRDMEPHFLSLAIHLVLRSLMQPAFSQTLLRWLQLLANDGAFQRLGMVTPEMFRASEVELTIPWKFAVTLHLPPLAPKFIRATPYSTLFLKRTRLPEFEAVLLIKPEAVEFHQAILMLLRRSLPELAVVGHKRMWPNQALMAAHYREHKDKPFFRSLLRRMTRRGPVHVVLLRVAPSQREVGSHSAKNDGVASSPSTGDATSTSAYLFRRLHVVVGPCDPAYGSHVTLRAQFGRGSRKFNGMHVSANKAAGHREAALWFPEHCMC